MKSYTLLMASFILVIAVHGQEIKPGKWEGGLGLGYGIYTQEPSVGNASINLDGDYFISKSFSVFGHADYNRSFVPQAMDYGSFGFATTHIGPRAHIGKKLFVGIGAGTAFFTSQGESSWIFSYYPQAGVHFRNLQLAADYKVISGPGGSLGIAELGVVFKTHHDR